MVGIISLVGQQGFGLDLRQQRVGLCDVMDLSGGEAERQRIAYGIDDHMDFGREPAARAANGLVEPGFFWAPALC